MRPALMCSKASPTVPFDPPRQYAREQTIFGKTTPFYGWHYPPYFLFIAGALAKLPYGLALTVWQAATLALYLLVILGIVRSSFRGARSASPESIVTIVPAESEKNRPSAQGLSIPDSRFAASGLTVLLALAYPAVLINIGHGQNGFLTAALLGGALVILDRRPIVAGILIGLLVYKPQFGLMIPLALLAGGYWRSFCRRGRDGHGTDARHDTRLRARRSGTPFKASTEFSRTVVLEQGHTGWYKIQSLFSWARMWGAPIPLAYALQGALTVALGIAIVRLWRSAAAHALKSAALCLAAILATPYSLDYDMMVLAPAIAFFAVDGLQRGFRPMGENRACGAVARTARHAQRGAGHPDTARGSGHAGDVHAASAARGTRNAHSPVAFNSAPFDHSYRRRGPSAAVTTSPRSTSRPGIRLEILQRKSTERGDVHALLNAAFRATATRRGWPWRSSAFRIGWSRSTSSRARAIRPNFC